MRVTLIDYAYTYYFGPEDKREQTYKYSTNSICNQQLQIYQWREYLSFNMTDKLKK
jgi:hypothetical protein